MTNLNKTCYDQSLKRQEDCVTSFGIDRVWSKSSNRITYLNSFKMKLSIVLGVIHMLLGIFVKGLNTLYFRKFVDFFFEFVP
jgi:V-type H+-transporting ATPase subunit a